MTKLEPKFPRCVNGRNYRKPFENQDFEALAQRIDRLYSEAPLARRHREILLGEFDHLAYAERMVVNLRLLTSRPSSAPVPWTESRPGAAELRGSCIAGESLELAAGYYHRVDEYVDRLTEHYFDEKRVGDDI